MRFCVSGLGALAFLLLCFSTANADNTPCINWPASDFTPNQHAKVIAPDYGLYWFKNNTTKSDSEQIMRAYTPKSLVPYFANGKKNNAPGPQQASAYAQAKTSYLNKLEKQHFFNPNAPTMIFIHGWQPGNTAKKYRFSLCYRYKTSNIDYSPIYNTLQYWKDKGWNVAVFYWNQFADEQQVLDAESKIYPGVDPLNRRWAYLDNGGALHYCDHLSEKRCMALPQNAQGQNDSITDLAFAAYKNALPSNYHQAIRLLGFSLGSQIAIQLADKVVNDPQIPQLHRLVLLDPYFSINAPRRLGMSIAEFNSISLLDIIAKTHNTLPISIYRSSPFSKTAYEGLFTNNPNLKPYIAYTRLHPKYLIGSGLQLMTEEHISAPYLYFQSMRAQPHFDCKAKGQCAWNSYINAAATNQQVSEMAGLSRFQHRTIKHESERDFPNTQYDRFWSEP